MLSFVNVRTQTCGDVPGQGKRSTEMHQKLGCSCICKHQFLMLTHVGSLSKTQEDEARAAAMCRNALHCNAAPIVSCNRRVLRALKKKSKAAEQVHFALWVSTSDRFDRSYYCSFLLLRFPKRGYSWKMRRCSRFHLHFRILHS